MIEWLRNFFLGPDRFEEGKAYAWEKISKGFTIEQLMSEHDAWGYDNFDLGVAVACAQRARINVG